MKQLTGRRLRLLLVAAICLCVACAVAMFGPRLGPWPDTALIYPPPCPGDHLIFKYPGNSPPVCEAAEKFGERLGSENPK